MFLKNTKLIVIASLVFVCSSTCFATASKVSISPEESAFKLIKMHINNDRTTKAMIELNRIQGKSASNPKFYIYSANLLLKEGQLDEAENMAKKAVKISYNNSDAFVTLGNIYIQRFMLSENIQENQDARKAWLSKAFQYFVTAYKYNPASPFAHIGLASSYYINSQSALAQDEIQKANELGFNNCEAIFAIGEYYYKIKEYDNAKSFLEKSLKLGLTSIYKTYYLLGTIYEQEGTIDKAQKNYLLALKIKPDDAKSQQNLDRLIKITYKEIEETSKKPATTRDMFNDLNEELNIVMQADYNLAIDEFTEARSLYIKILSKNPANINAITGLAELYYAKWSEGFATSADFVSDSKYIVKVAENSRNIIPLTKFKLINEEKMPELVRQKFISLSVSETFDFYDLLNEVRAEFLLGNYEDSHSKFKKLLDFNLSNYEKFKVLKSLCYDHNYDEAIILINELKKTYYHNEELSPIINRINEKISVVQEKIDKAAILFSQKNEKDNDYAAAESIIRQTLLYYPTSQKAYINYAYLLEKQKRYKEAAEKAKTALLLTKIFPDKTGVVQEADIKKFIQSLSQKQTKS